MANFESKKIELLLGISLAKAGVERDRKGFKRLSQLINEDSAKEAPHIEQKYLDESFHKQLLKAQEHGHSTIGLNDEYVNTITNFVGYQDFNDFENSFNRLWSMIVVDQEYNIQFLFQSELEEKVKNFVDQFSSFTKDSKLNFHFNGVSEVNSSSTAIKSSADKFDYFVFFLSKQQLDVSFGEFPTNQSLPVLLYDGNNLSEMDKRVYFKRDLPLFFQMLVSSSSLIERKKHIKRSPGSDKIKISNAGMVNLGKIGRIKAEYVSSRDMHININKGE